MHTLRIVFIVVLSKLLGACTIYLGPAMDTTPVNIQPSHFFTNVSAGTPRPLTLQTTSHVSWDISLCDRNGLHCESLGNAQNGQSVDVGNRNVSELTQIVLWRSGDNGPDLPTETTQLIIRGAHGETLIFRYFRTLESSPPFYLFTLNGIDPRQ